MVEVLNPGQACLVVGLSVISYLDTPDSWNTSLFIPAGLVVFYGKDDKWWYSPALSINSSDDYSPLVVTRLG